MAERAGPLWEDGGEKQRRKRPERERSPALPAIPGMCATVTGTACGSGSAVWNRMPRGCNKIYFVTWGHVPKWLNGNHPKLEIVRHEDYIPGEFLPTFNSHTIELNFHRIPGLSEQFVYFNDDMFLLQQVSPGQFFRDGKPLDMLALQPVVANREDAVMPYIYLNNAMVLARYFDKRENMKQQPGAYWHPGYPLLYFGYNLLERMFPRFTGFYTVHGPSPLLKNTYEALWQREERFCRRFAATDSAAGRM